MILKWLYILSKKFFFFWFIMFHFFQKNEDIDKIVVSNKFPFGKKRFKSFISYKDAKKIKRLHVFLQKMTAYKKDFDETKYVPFLITDDKWWRKYNEIWEKVTNIIYKELDSDPVYNKKYIKTKIKPYNGKINANFQGNKIPIEGSHFIFLSMIWIDSFLRTGKIVILKCF